MQKDNKIKSNNSVTLTESEIRSLLEKNPKWEPDKNSTAEVFEIFNAVKRELRAKISKLEDQFFSEQDDEKLQNNYTSNEDSYSNFDDEY